MKTSPELLTDILGVLGQINTKMDVMANKPEKKSSIGIGGVMAAVQMGKSVGKGGKGGMANMASDIKKLNTELAKVNMAKLEKLVKTVNSYDSIKSEERKQKTSRISAIGSAAKDSAMALLIMGGAITAFAVGFKVAEAALKMKPMEILGFVLLSAGVLALSMLMLSGADTAGSALAKKLGTPSPGKEGEEPASAAEKAKQMGIALMYIAGGILAFSVTLALVPLILKTGSIIGGVLMVGAVIMGMAAMMALLGLASKFIDPGIATAKGIGMSIMILSAGIMVVAITSILLVQIYKDRDGVKRTKGESALSIAGNAFGALGLFGLFLLGAVGALYLMGQMAVPIGVGSAVSWAVALSLLILSVGVLTVATTSKVLLEMFKTPVKAGEKQKGPLSTLGNAVVGLGMFGLFVAAAAGMLWVLGIPLVSGPIILGSIALITMSAALLAVSYTIKKVANVMKTMNLATIKKNVSDMVGGVMAGVMEGVMGSGIDKNKDGELSIKELRQFRRVTKAIKLLGRISKTLSNFAMGLTAFAKLGEISSLEYEEKTVDGITELKPKIGKSGKIHVVEISRAIADTFGLFIKTLVQDTETLTVNQGKAIKKLGKALTGERGIISAVMDFSKLLKTYAQFGEKNEIFVVDPTDPTNLKKGKSVPIKKIVENIIKSFMMFVTEISTKGKVFEEAKESGKKMLAFNELLMGKKRSKIGSWFASDKPGILGGLMQFNKMLSDYAKMGTDGLIPVEFNADGNPIKYKHSTLIAKDIVKSIMDFVNSFNAHLSQSNKALEKSTANVKPIEQFVDQMDKLTKLSKDIAKIDKLSISIGSLATNIGQLSTNMANLKTDNLEKLANVAIKNSPNAASSSSSSSSFGNYSNNNGNLNETQLEILATKIANKINSNQSGTYDFIFHDANKGKIEVKFH